MIQTKRDHDSVVQTCQQLQLYIQKLHTKLFAEQKEGIRLIWEYINLMYQDYDGDEYLKNYRSQFDSFKKLSKFYGKFGTLPLTEEK